MGAWVKYLNQVRNSGSLPSVFICVRAFALLAESVLGCCAAIARQTNDRNVVRNLDSCGRRSDSNALGRALNVRFFLCKGPTALGRLRPLTTHKGLTAFCVADGSIRADGVRQDRFRAGQFKSESQPSEAHPFAL